MKTIRILSLDGGGMRGLCSAWFLKLFFQQGNMDGSKVSRYFDLVAGTSIGGVQALAYVYGQTPDAMIQFFTTYGPQIFQSSSGLGGRASKAWKVSVMALGGQTWLGITYPKTFYYNTVLVQQLKAIFGTTLLGNLPTNVLIPAYEYTTQTPQLFSNAALPSFNGRNYQVWECAAATGAAPLYFPPITIREAPPAYQYIDGGTYQNNPAALALSMAYALYPGADRICLLSVGTGLGEIGFNAEPDSIEKRDRAFVSDNLRAAGWSEEAIQGIFKGIDHPKRPSLRDDPPLGASPVGDDPPVGADPPQPDETSNMEKLMDLIDIGIAGPQEAVHQQLSLQSWYGAQGGKRLFYYRFQPQFDPEVDTELDNTSPEFLSYMQQMAAQMYAQDQYKIAAFLQNMAIG